MSQCELRLNEPNASQLNIATVINNPSDHEFMTITTLDMQPQPTTVSHHESTTQLCLSVAILKCLSQFGKVNFSSESNCILRLECQFFYDVYDSSGCKV